MKVSVIGLNLIKKWEGFYSKAYKDPVGIWTIGYGTTMWESGQKVKQGDTITQEKALSLLEKQVNQHTELIPSYVKIELNQNQFDALASFHYNLGKHILSKDSALVRYLNQKDWENVVRVMKMYNKAGGKVLNGLVNRRNDEAYLFMKPINNEKYYVVVGGFQKDKAEQFSNEMKSKGFYNYVKKGD